MARETQLAQAFVGLAEAMVSGRDVVEFLHHLCRDAVTLLDVDAAGVLLADEDDELRAVAASDEGTHLLEVFGVAHQEGPCSHVYHTGVIEQASALDAARRWPAFTQLAQRHGYQWFCGVPLKWGAESIGALNLFRTREGALAAEDLTIARALANVATMSLLQRRETAQARLLAGQLQTALSSRVLIEQAKGTLAERLGVSLEEAFVRMRAAARDTNRKLHDVAYDVVHGRAEGAG